MVALPTEGVDRNGHWRCALPPVRLSPSPRRAWIEMGTGAVPCPPSGCRPPHGGRG